MAQKKKKTEARRMETDYLERVRDSLKGREASEIDEIIQSLQEHIEEELSGDLDGEVTLVQMANVLERLGPPEAYASESGALESDLPVDAAVPKSRVYSGYALAAGLSLPVAIFVGILAWLLLTLPALELDPDTVQALVNLLVGAILFAGGILGCIALRQINSQPEKYDGKFLAWIGILQIALIIIFLFYWASLPGGGSV